MEKLFFFILFGILSFEATEFHIQQKKLEGTDKIGFNPNTTISVPGSVRVVENFLLWYRQNYEEISKISLIENYGNDSDSIKLYHVNFSGTEVYLNKLLSSGFISDKYLKKWQEYFKKKDGYFKKLPQKDGPPMGFNYDFILWTEELEQTLEAIDNLIVVQVNETNETSFVEIDIRIHLGFHLTKYGELWMIDAIENMGY